MFLSSITFSTMKNFDYLPTLNIESFFRTSTVITYSIISTLNLNKSDGPNSIPTRIMKLLNKDLSDQLENLFNQLFLSRIFPSILKTKIIPTYKKGSKLEFSNYSPISFLSNIDRILERFNHNDLIITI